MVFQIPLVIYLFQVQIWVAQPSKSCLREMFLWFKTDLFRRTQFCKDLQVCFIYALCVAPFKSVTAWSDKTGIVRTHPEVRICRTGPDIFLLCSRKNVWSQWFKVMKRVLRINKLRKASTNIVLPGQNFSYMSTNVHPHCTELQAISVVRT